MLAISNEIKIVIGSWGSYNECNERAYGSKWLDLADYSDWEDYGRETFESMGYEVENWILDYFDFKAYGESFQYDGDITEYSEGLIEIY